MDGTEADGGRTGEGGTVSVILSFIDRGGDSIVDPMREFSVFDDSGICDITLVLPKGIKTIIATIETSTTPRMMKSITSPLFWRIYEPEFRFTIISKSNSDT